MNNATKSNCLPPLIANVLHDPLTQVDNLFADTWQQLLFGSLIRRAGFRKRSGTDIVDVVFLLLLWRWVDVSSISMFARKLIKKAHKMRIKEFVKVLDRKKNALAEAA